MSSRLQSNKSGERDPDVRTYFILAMDNHFGLLITAKVAPWCRTGVAWVFRVACGMLSGVGDLGVLWTSSSCVFIGGRFVWRDRRVEVGHVKICDLTARWHKTHLLS